MENKQAADRLLLWQTRYAKSSAAYAEELRKIDEREELYRGNADIRGIGGERISPLHTRNIIAENIESQIVSTIPRPRVQAVHEEDEPLAALVERLIACELDRLPMERLNDMDERTAPLQGGSGWLAEWDDAAGGVALSLLHPKRILPQEGVSESEEMDYFILQIPESRRRLEERYGVSLAGETEKQPELRDGLTADEEMLTCLIGYERRGTVIDRFTWVGDTVLEDLPDYEAPRRRVCKRCGADPKTAVADFGVTLGAEEQAKLLAARFGGDAPPKPDGGADADEELCPFCHGSAFLTQSATEELLFSPVLTARGAFLPGARTVMDENGVLREEPTRLPLYRPGLYPMTLRKNVSVFGKFLGDSDADKIRDQQNTVSLLEQKILHRFCDAGTRITLPNDPEITLDRRDQRVIHVKNAADVAAIKTVDFSGDLSQEMVYLASVYQEARQAIGITNSYLGETDVTASSGKAKQFSAAQAAGRLQSKRVMKQALYQDLFLRIFRLHLAYDTAPCRFRGENGAWEEFDRYDFLRQNEDGSFSWNDEFLFFCDETEPPANDRERRWQETTELYRGGAFGDPADDRVRLLFWKKMERLHYPGAGETYRDIDRRLQSADADAASQETRKNPNP